MGETHIRCCPMEILISVTLVDWKSEHCLTISNLKSTKQPDLWDSATASNQGTELNPCHRKISWMKTEEPKDLKLQAQRRAACCAKSICRNSPWHRAALRLAYGYVPIWSQFCSNWFQGRESGLNWGYSSDKNFKREDTLQVEEEIRRIQVWNTKRSELEYKSGVRSSSFWRNGGYFNMWVRL